MGDSKKTGLEFERVSRRKAVKTIVGGVSALAAYNILPVKWEKPIIEQIFLPVHAATSGLSLSDPCNITVVKGTQDSSSVTIKVTGFVIPPASGIPVSIQAYGTPSSSKESVKTTTNKEGRFESTLVLTTTSGIGTVHVTTTAEGASGAAKCSLNVAERSAPAEDSPSEQNPVLVATAGPLTITVEDQFDNPVDEISLIFNGTNAQLVQNSTGGADQMIQFDFDHDLPNWDWYNNGSNWPTYPDNWSGPSPVPSNTGENNLLPGSYSFEAAYGPTGNRYRVFFTVSITPLTPDTARDCTVSGVEIYAI